MFKTATIGNDVWMGHNVNVLSGINIGDGAVIAAGAVVTKDVPPYAVMAGVPATVKRLRFPEKIIERLLRSRWWDLELAAAQRTAVQRHRALSRRHRTDPKPLTGCCRSGLRKCPVKQPSVLQS